MSVTNRGIIRKENDFYPTPAVVIETFLDNYHIGDKGEITKILEPCAGNGNIIKALQERGYTSIKAVELRKEEAENLNNMLGYGNFAIADFLTLNPKHIGDIDVVITNPPFSLAMEFLQKSLEIVKNDGKVILLLRLGFLASRKRFGFMRENPPTEMYVLNQRPSFTGKGTDAQEYAWFVWDKAKEKQKIRVI